MNSLREMTQLDLEQVLQIEEHLFGQTAWSRKMYEDELSRLGQSRWYQVLESTSQIIGYIGVAYVGEDADIQTIAITTESQRKGYGEQLIITALNFLSKHGIKKVFLEVEVNNSPAISMYQKLGFQNLTIRLNYYGPGKNAQTMVLDLKDDADE